MFKVNHSPTGYVAELNGDITIFQAKEFFESIKPVALKQKNLALDLSAVTHIDSSILQILMAIHQHLLQQGCVLTLVNHSPVVIDALEIMGLSRWFNDPVLISRKTEMPEGSQ